jgi:hypothetical protein
MSPAPIYELCRSVVRVAPINYTLLRLLSTMVHHTFVCPILQIEEMTSSINVRLMDTGSNVGASSIEQIVFYGRAMHEAHV